MLQGTIARVALTFERFFRSELIAVAMRRRTSEFLELIVVRGE